MSGGTNQAARRVLQIEPHKIESTGTADSTGYVHDTHEPAGPLAALPSTPAAVFFSWERPRSLSPFISGSHHNETSKSLSLVDLLPVMSRGQPRRSCVTTMVQQAGTNPSQPRPMHLTKRPTGLHARSWMRRQVHYLMLFPGPSSFAPVLLTPL